MPDDKKEIARILTEARQAMFDAEKVLKDKKDLYELTKSGWREALDASARTQRRVTQQFMDECFQNESLLAKLKRVVIKKTMPLPDQYEYWQVFHEVGVPIGGKNSQGETICVKPRRIIKITTDHERIEKLEASLAESKTADIFIKLPYCEDDSWREAMPTVIAFFFYRCPKKKASEKLDDAIMKAKAFIEENQYLADCKYGDSLYECLFCIANGDPKS